MCGLVNESVVLVQHPVQLSELEMRSADREADLVDLHCLHHSAVSQLLQHELRIE